HRGFRRPGSAAAANPAAAAAAAVIPKLAWVAWLAATAPNYARAARLEEIEMLVAELAELGDALRMLGASIRIGDSPPAAGRHGYDRLVEQSQVQDSPARSCKRRLTLKCQSLAAGSMRNELKEQECLNTGQGGNDAGSERAGSVLLPTRLQQFNVGPGVPQLSGHLSPLCAPRRCARRGRPRRHWWRPFSACQSALWAGPADRWRRLRRRGPMGGALCAGAGGMRGRGVYAGGPHPGVPNGGGIHYWRTIITAAAATQAWAGRLSTAAAAVALAARYQQQPAGRSRRRQRGATVVS
uniref:WASH_WAHD domain-containing protein n=1 Tax=Macrostomum lignano TaxID=282301 RepID=A0A1I8FCW3_9PLAT